MSNNESINVSAAMVRKGVRVLRESGLLSGKISIFVQSPKAGPQSRQTERQIRAMPDLFDARMPPYPTMPSVHPGRVRRTGRPARRCSPATSFQVQLEKMYGADGRTGYRAARVQIALIELTTF